MCAEVLRLCDIHCWRDVMHARRQRQLTAWRLLTTPSQRLSQLMTSLITTAQHSMKLCSASKVLYWHLLQANGNSVAHAGTHNHQLHQLTWSSTHVVLPGVDRGRNTPPDREWEREREQMERPLQNIPHTHTHTHTPERAKSHMLWRRRPT